MLSTDEDKYPTDEALTRIEQWSHKDGFRALMNQVKAIWTYADAGYWTEKGTEIHASTAGWSGNESIIGALQRNHIFWALCWVQSRRGGHYIFEVKS